MGLLLRINHLLRCWSWLSLLKWIGALTSSLLLKLPLKKLEPWFVLWSFFLLLLLYISINLPCGHAWSVGPSLAASLEPFTHCRNIASLFYSYYFGRCSFELARLVPLPYSPGRSTRYSDRLHDFSVTIPRCYKDVYVNSFIPCTARLWNSLPIECFPLTYDLNGFKSRINRHLLTVGSF